MVQRCDIAYAHIHAERHVQFPCTNACRALSSSILVCTIVFFNRLSSLLKALSVLNDAFIQNPFSPHCLIRAPLPKYAIAIADNHEQILPTRQLHTHDLSFHHKRTHFKYCIDVPSATHMQFLRGSTASKYTHTLSLSLDELSNAITTTWEYPGYSLCGRERGRGGLV